MKEITKRSPLNEFNLQKKKAYLLFCAKKCLLKVHFSEINIAVADDGEIFCHLAESQIHNRHFNKNPFNYMGCFAELQRRTL